MGKNLYDEDWKDNEWIWEREKQIKKKIDKENKIKRDERKTNALEEIARKCPQQ